MKDFFILPQNYITKEEDEKFRKDNGIKIIGDVQIPHAVFSYAGYPFPPRLFDWLKRNSHLKPSLLESQVLPAFLKGINICCINRGISGTSMAYMLSMAVHVINQPLSSSKTKTKWPIALVLCPTRELAIGSQSLFATFEKEINLKSGCVFGGVPKRNDFDTFAKEPDIIFATPGRLLDHIEIGLINLEDVSFLVFQEMDRILDMGFGSIVDRIMPTIGFESQKIMFTSENNEEVTMFSEKYFDNLVKIEFSKFE